MTDTKNDIYRSRFENAIYKEAVINGRTCNRLIYTDGGNLYLSIGIPYHTLCRNLDKYDKGYEIIWDMAYKNRTQIIWGLEDLLWILESISKKEA